MHPNVCLTGCRATAHSGEEPTEANMSGSTDRIGVKCMCGAKMKVPAAAAGRKAKCPSCGKVFKVPAPRQSAPPPVSETHAAEVHAGAAAGAADDGTYGFAAEAGSDSLFDDLAAAESSGVAVETEDRAAVAGGGKPCPNCGVPMTPGAAKCGVCGADPKAIKAQSRQRAAAGVGAAAAVAGRFALGCGLSAGAAIVGAAVWAGVAYATDREIGWIAWGIGIAAGFGMVAGAQASGVLHGAVASGMAVVGIIAGKLVIFTAILSPELVKIEQEIAAGSLVSAVLQEQGIAEVDATDEQFEAAYETAGNRVDQMSQPEIHERAADFVAEQGEEYPALTFWSVCFDWMDVLFIALAVGSAFKLGVSGMPGGGSSS